MSAIPPHEMAAIRLTLVPMYPQVDPAVLEKSMLEVQKVLDAWINENSTDILKLLHDLRLKLAVAKGDAAQIEKFKKVPQLDDDESSTPSDTLSETPSVSVPIPAILHSQQQLPVYEPMPPLQETSSMPNDFMDVAGVSTPIPDTAALEETHSAPGISETDSLNFSNLVSSSGTDVQAQADQIRKKQRMSAYCKDIFTMLCEMSLF
jgi:hypothetical protein